MKKYKNISRYTISGLAKPGEIFEVSDEIYETIKKFVKPVPAPQKKRRNTKTEEAAEK